MDGHRGDQSLDAQGNGLVNHFHGLRHGSRIGGEGVMHIRERPIPWQRKLLRGVSAIDNGNPDRRRQ
jgi:hypothetical protein